MSERWLIVGLGNPGSQYARTRHNAGFWFLDALDRTLSLGMRPDKKFHGDFGRTRLDGVELGGLRPDTFMNDSGRSVRAVTDYFQISIEKVLVAYDDLDLVPGTVRLKLGGGHGGHNGLRSLFSHLGEQGFWRLRIGIGHPGIREAVTPWVLTRASTGDEQAILAGIEKSVGVLPDLLQGRGERAMQVLHTAEPDRPTQGD